MIYIDKKSTPDRSILDLESMDFSCMKVLGMYNYNKIKTPLSNHKHKGMFELCFLEKGEQHYTVEEKEYCLKGGEYLIIYPNECHGTSIYSEEKGKLFWILFDFSRNKPLLNLSMEETKIILELLFNKKDHRKSYVDKQVFKCLNQIFKILKDESNSLLSKMKISHLLLSIFLYLIDYKTKKSGLSAPIAKTKLYIEENFEEYISMENLSQLANLSLSHFKSKFKKEMGFSPGDYITRQRINRAKEMLIRGESVSDISYDLMFASPSYFATVFKKYVGITPTQFRKNTSTAPL